MSLIGKWLNQRNISKRKLLLIWTKFRGYEGFGNQFTGFFIGTITEIGLILAIIKILVPEIEVLIVGGWVVFAGILNRIINFVIGYFYKRWGAVEINAEWNAKHLNPYDREMMDTQKAICKKLGVKHNFTELEDEK